MPAFSCSSRHFTHFAIYRIIFGVDNFSRGVFVCSERKCSIFVSVLFCFYLLLWIKFATLHNGSKPRPVFVRGFPDFPMSRFSSRMLVCWIQWGRERRIILKRFVTVVAWKCFKISCFFPFCRLVFARSGLAPSPTSGPLILPVLGKFEKPCALISPPLNLRDDILFIFGSISDSLDIWASLCSARKLIKYSKPNAVRGSRNAFMRDFPDFCWDLPNMLTFSCCSRHFTHFTIYIYRIIFGVGNFSRGFFVCRERKCSILFVSVLFWFYLLL